MSIRSNLESDKVFGGPPITAFMSKTVPRQVPITNPHAYPQSSSSVTQGANLTYGEQWIGVTFNVSKNPEVSAKVNVIKHQAAALYDSIRSLTISNGEPFRADLERTRNSALSHVTAAAMESVKVVTFGA